MQTRLMVAVAITVTASPVGAQGPWGNVKTWTGTITIEATDARKIDRGKSRLGYKAAGSFSITDDMMPDGSHMQWPMPGAEALSDPAKLEEAYNPWRVRLVASYEQHGINELDRPASLTCSADNRVRAKVGLTIDPDNDDYRFEIVAPEPEFICSDQKTTRVASTDLLRRATLRLTGRRGGLGPVTNTKTFTFGTTIVRVSLTMGPK